MCQPEIKRADVLSSEMKCQGEVAVCSFIDFGCLSQIEIATSMKGSVCKPKLKSRTQTLLIGYCKIYVYL